MNQTNRENAFKRLDRFAESLRTSKRIDAIISTGKRLGVGPVLVGGALRDAILGRSTADYDIAVPFGALSFARAIAEETGSTYVQLDDIYGSGRVVFENGNSIDITDFRKETIEEDCKERDLTCNALAAPLPEFLEKGSAVVLDPTGAIEDIIKGVIRPYQMKNLVDDPLRILRVFRYSAQIGFVVTLETLDYIREHAELLSQPAAERVLAEMKLIFRSRNAASVLSAMLNTGTLSALFGFFSIHELSEWVGRATFIERTIARYPALPGLQAAKTDYLNFLLVTMLAATKPGPRITDLIVALRLSKRVAGRVMRVGMSMVSVRRLVYDYPIETDFLYTSARIALALREDRLAPWLITASDKDYEMVFKTLEKAEKLIVETVLPVADAPPLITGAELAERLDKAPGPWISEALERVFFRRLTGRITEKEGAISFIKQLLKDSAL